VTLSQLSLPAGGLVALVGVAGSGKSTFAAGHFPASAVLSSDAFRSLVAGDPADQTATDEAFSILHQVLDLRLGRGLLTVVDATNVQPWARRKLLEIARRRRRPAAAIVLDLPLTLCLERNATRTAGRLPAAAIRRQYRSLRDSLNDLKAEGFDSVHRLTEAATADHVRLEFS
jgi:protein phosphatase